nr:rod-binding protein [Gemmobacter straminiformis]
MPVIPPLSSVTPPASSLRAKAQDLETAFLAEMLGHAGLGPQQGAFTGGIGEEQFASFLREAQAKAMVRAGGIGLTEALFRAMGGKDAAG